MAGKQRPKSKTQKKHMTPQTKNENKNKKKKEKINWSGRRKPFEEEAMCYDTIIHE